MLYGVYLLLTLEIGLQAAAWLSPRLDLILSNRFGEPPYVEDQVLGLRPNPRYGDHDAWGFRNAGQPDRADVVALGDSQTYGVSAPPEEAWPQQLSRRLGLRVYNMGCGSWGPGQYLPLLPKVAALHPAIVVAVLYTGNDLWDMLELAYLRRSIPEVAAMARQDEDLATRVAQTRELLLITSAQAARLLGGDSGGTPAPGPIPRGRGVVPALRERSRVWGAARAFKSLLARPRSRAAVTVDDSDWPALFSAAAADRAVAVCGTGPTRTLLDAGYRAQAFAEDLWPEGLRLAVEALALVRDRLARDGIPTVVLLIPTKELAYAGICDEAQLQRGEYQRLVASEREARARAIRDLAARGIPVVDGLPGLEHALAAGRGVYPRTLDSHPNGAGYGIIADVMAETLAKREPAPQRGHDR